MRLSRLSLALIVSFFLLMLSSWKSEAEFQWKYPPLTQLHVTDKLSTDLAILALGSHRVAADVAYIQFLQYYGTPEVDPDEHDLHDHDHAHFDYSEEEHLENTQKEHPAAQASSQDGLVRPEKRKLRSHMDLGEYVELYSYGKRVLYLDPFFHKGLLEVAGGLAFNVQRPDEASAFLREALRLDPTFHRYRLYLSAVLFKNQGKDIELLDALNKAIQYPDCPVMLENILANLNKKYGRFLQAGQVYVHILETVSKEADRQTAQRKLVELIQQHPEITKQIESLLQQD